ncbi:unnamed protein product [Diatraea saccharalis]|uniref:DUF4795 domain-containing protein n=1 Tax=Diatraea saccharalis TaxID=40085 RepID=A0A9N9N243_9NEOP|nr:unnamed protein product [Diatraea saccharalis]
MAENPAILLNISEMIDLAIGTPECGVVDFNMLQTVLHVLAQQLHVLGKNVELRGSAANLPQYTGKEHLQTIVVNEFEYEIDKDKTTDKEKPVMKIATTAVHKSEEPDTILVVAGGPPGTVGGTARGPVGGTTGGTASGNAGGTAGGTADGTAGGTAGGILGSTADGTPVRSTAGTTAGTAPTSAVSTMATSAGGPLPRLIPQSSTEKLSLVTASKFNILENAVEDLRNRVYGSIPKNDQILEEVRSQTNMKAITDMWTSLNVSSRLEAAEEGIAKLSSLVQDLIGETTSLQDSLSRRPTLAEANVSTLPMEQQTDQQASDPTGPVGTATGTTPVSGRSVKTLQGDDSRGVKKHLDKIRTDLDELTRTFYKAMEDIHGGQKSSTGRSSIVAADVMTRINELEKKLNKCCDSIKKNDGVIQDQINSFQDQLEGLMRQVATLTQDLAAGKLSPDLIKDLQGLMELFTTVQNMQEQLKQVHETALELAAEKDDRQHNIDALLEQIELLKAIKLDREDMFEAMADKADVRMLARKVSHDQFELACDDLAKGLEQTLGKLNLQEAIWQQALDDIQREIEMKLDKMELSPVKDFFNNKLRQLQDNLKRMASLRQEAEAAGTKKKLLRDVKCISCDAKAVMNAEAPSTVPVSRPLPANMSMKPYLSYELDAIRKTQQTNMPQRNMHDWEAIDKQMGPKPPPKPKSEGDKHLCNRYCGGSHTVTTAAQRVARLGHFVKQWGPDVLPLSSGLAAGDDGRVAREGLGAPDPAAPCRINILTIAFQYIYENCYIRKKTLRFPHKKKLYKVTTTEAANVGPGGAVDPTCTPKPPPKENQEKPKPPPRPMVLSNECRCLDGGK